MPQIIMVSSKNQWVSAGESSQVINLIIIHFLLPTSSHILQNTQVRQVKHCDSHWCIQEFMRAVLAALSLTPSP